MIRSLFVVLLALVSIHTYGQQTASQVLSSAERDYELGKLSNIPQRLEPFFRKEREGGFNKSERIRAQKLITLAYIFTDNEPRAEESLVKLLKLDPEHKRDPRVDPAEFYFLYDKFQVAPIFRISAKAGVNKSVININQSYCTCSVLDQNLKFYNGADIPEELGFEGQGTIGIGYWGELTVEKHIWNGIEAGLGGQFRISRYDVDQKLLEVNNIVTYIANQQTYLRFPAYFRYNYRYFKEIGPIPYVTAGATFDYLLDARYVEATRQGGTAYSPTEIITLNDVALEQANPYNLSVFGALGVKLRIKTHFLTFEARYDHSLFNYIDNANRWNGEDRTTWALAFTEDDLNINMLSFSIGYTHSIYWPRKKKEFR